MVFTASSRSSISAFGGVQATVKRVNTSMLKANGAFVGLISGSIPGVNIVVLMLLKNMQTPLKEQYKGVIRFAF